MDFPRPPPGDRGYALLVDADGAEPDVVAALTDALALGCPVPIRRLHGNLHGQDLGKSWEKLARLKGFERLHRPRTTATKNGADIAMALDALDLVGQGVRYFCLVAGDTDFGPLVERLHRANCTTTIVAANPALHAWSPHAFTFEQVKSWAQPMAPKATASAQPAVQPPTHKTPTPANPTTEDGVDGLLRKALAAAAARGYAEDGWVDTDRLGPLFTQVDKDYTRKKYGLSNSASVRSMALRFPGAFEITTKTIKDVRHTFVRIKT